MPPALFPFAPPDGTALVAVGQTVYVRVVKLRPTGYASAHRPGVTIPGRGVRLYPPYEKLRNDIQIGGTWVEGRVTQVVLPGAVKVRSYRANAAALA